MLKVIEQEVLPAQERGASGSPTKEMIRACILLEDAECGANGFLRKKQRGPATWRESYPAEQPWRTPDWREHMEVIELQEQITGVPLVAPVPASSRRLASGSSSGRTGARMTSRSAAGRSPGGHWSAAAGSGSRGKRSGQQPPAPSIGWVTIAIGGQPLAKPVPPSGPMKLAAQVRQQQVAHWNRRLAVHTDRECERAKAVEDQREQERDRAVARERDKAQRQIDREKQLELQRRIRAKELGRFKQQEQKPSGDRANAVASSLEELARATRLLQLAGSDDCESSPRLAAATSPARASPTTRSPNRAYVEDLKADPRRIGFAYGGVNPGRLHARGQLVEEHQVHYSIGASGHYLMHVRLRRNGQRASLPGSPFLLHVTAGMATPPLHAHTAFEVAVAWNRRAGR